MGCDIHLYVELKDGDRWVSADIWAMDTTSHPDYPFPYVVDPYWEDRHYVLFAMLADVRNSWKITPIAPPRGLPSDASPTVREWYEEGLADYHTPSWHTVADLMAYDWTQETTVAAQVSAVAYEEWERWGKKAEYPPQSIDYYCKSHRKITEEEMLAEVQAARQKANNNRRQTREILAASLSCTKVTWQAQYHQLARRFVGGTLPRLWRLGNYDEVRIVFFFDN